MSPISSTNILSRPEGPKVFFTMFAIASIAVTLIKLFNRCLFSHLDLNLFLLEFLLMDFNALRYLIISKIFKFKSEFIILLFKSNSFL